MKNCKRVRDLVSAGVNFLSVRFWLTLRCFSLLLYFLQIDGRCHRHGQTNAVYVKCYYVPMSMESQLLDRRKRAKEITGTSLPATSHSTNDRTINFSNLYGDDSDDDA